MNQVATNFSKWWDAFFYEVLPVTPPDAQISSSSNLKQDQCGKAPGFRYSDGTWTGAKDWQIQKTTRLDCRTWQGWGANVGLRTALCPALDIDIFDDNLADFINEIEELAKLILGPAPVRIGNAPKRLLLYRTEEPVRKQIVSFKVSDDDATIHKIEFLGQGQQCVVEGTHPCGRAYTWDIDPTTIGRNNLTLINSQDIDAFLSALLALIERHGFVLAKGQMTGTSVNRENVDQESLKGDDLDFLADAIARIPNNNTEFPDYADYIRMGVAIKAAFQDDEDRGREVFLEWALRWEGDGKNPEGNNPSRVERDYSYFNPPFGIGAEYLLQLAAKYGLGAEIAAVEFKSLETEYESDLLQQVNDLTFDTLPRFSIPLKKVKEEDYPLYLQCLIQIEQNLGVPADVINEQLTNNFAPPVSNPISVGWDKNAIKEHIIEILDGGISDLKRFADCVRAWDKTSAMPAKDFLALAGGALRRKMLDNEKTDQYLNPFAVAIDTALETLDVRTVISSPWVGSVLWHFYTHRKPQLFSFLNVWTEHDSWPTRNPRQLLRFVKSSMQKMERARKRKEMDRPNLFWDEFDMDKCAQEAMDILNRDTEIFGETPVFNYQNRLATVTQAETPTVSHLTERQNSDRPPTYKIVPFNIERLARKIASCMEVFTITPASKKPLRSGPPRRMVEIVAKSGVDDAAPLAGLCPIPTVNVHTRKLITTPGYDPRTQTFFTFDELSFTELPSRPDKATARRAYDYLINEVFADFEFNAPVDSAVAVSILLTSAMRMFFKSAPAFMITAPQQTSGKTELAQLIMTVINGEPTTAIPFSSDSAEIAKKLLTFLSANNNFMFFDNIPDNSILDSSELSTCITDSRYSNRVLGGNDEREVSTLVTWIATGNNIRVGRDLVSRFIECRLQPRIANPMNRNFSRKSPVAWAQHNRENIIRAILTIVLGYYRACDEEKLVPSSGSRFGLWSEHVRDPILWINDFNPEYDIQTKINSNIQDEENSSSRAELLRILYELFGTKIRFGVGEVMAAYNGNIPLEQDGSSSAHMDELVRDLKEVITDLLPRNSIISKIRLSKELKKLEGMFHKGLPLVIKTVNNQNTFGFTE